MTAATRFFLIFLVVGLGGARAAEADDLAAVRAADAARIAATIAGDTLQLASLLSDELHYAHSDGRVQTKAQFISAVATNRVKYLSFAPQDVVLQSIASGAVVMHGRAQLAAQTSEGQRVEFALRFLAIWRDEAGRWRLLAYQSSPLAEVPPPSR